MTLAPYAPYAPAAPLAPSDLAGSSAPPAAGAVSPATPGMTSDVAPSQADSFPLALLLEDKRVVLVGGGKVAARRAAAFAGAGARLRIVAPTLHPSIAELLGPQDEWVQREFILGDLTDAWLAHTATGDPAVDAEVAREAEWRHIFCINAGNRDAGTAAVPARATAHTSTGRVQVAVDSGDPRRSVAVARHMQDELESGRAPLHPRRRR